MRPPAEAGRYSNGVAEPVAQRGHLPHVRRSQHGRSTSPRQQGLGGRPWPGRWTGAGRSPQEDELMTMRVLVIGAGVIGSVYAGHLAEAGTTFPCSREAVASTT
jgi:hypothetical protein